MENEIIENTVTGNEENTITENSTNENIVSNDLAVDSLAVTLDYYDRYYEQMLNKSDNIIAHQETIINNQYEEIDQNNNIIAGLHVLVFLTAIFVIYQLLRNMIIVK